MVSNLNLNEQDLVERLSYAPDIERLSYVPDQNLVVELQERRSLMPSMRKSIRQTNVRWTVLLLGCLANFSIFFCLGNPQALQTPLEDLLNIQDTKFNLFHGINSFPNVIVPFFGGAIMDTLGVQATMLTLGGLVVLGQLVITAGAYIFDFEIMIAGRFIFGLGEATLELGLLTIIARWFLNKEMALAWGLARTTLRLGSALNSFLTPKLYAWTNLIYFPFLFGTILCILSLICLTAVISFDKKAAKQEEVQQGNFVEKIFLRQFRELPKTYFLILCTGVLVYMSFIGFTANVNNLLCRRFGFTHVSAGSLITTIYLVAASLSPIIGLIVDRVGRRANFLLFAVLVLFGTHIFFLLLEDRTSTDPNYNVVFGFVALGIFYATFATNLWPCIPFIVEPKVLGTACGLMSCLINGGISVFLEILGVIHDHTLDFHKGYFWTQIAQCVIICIALVMVTWAYIEDKKTNGPLHQRKMEMSQVRR